MRGMPARCMTLDPPPARRQHRREPIAACRSIAVQVADQPARPPSPWLAADILDLSLGGLCLLIHADGALALEPGLPLTLDVRSQPGFGVEQLPCHLIWHVRSGFGAALGLRFDQPLASLPPLQA